MSDSHYYKITLHQVPAQAVDPLTELVFTLGATGTAENLKFTQPNLRYDPELIPQDFISMDVFFDEPPSGRLWESIRSRWPEVRYESSLEQNKDWLEEWKKGYKPFVLVGEHWIVPSWLMAPVEAKQIIQIDPGMAFGTGTHETTQLAARALYDLRAQGEVTSVLDVGTGTGILAILATQLGAGEIIGLDIDPEARRVARENTRRNGCLKIQILDHELAGQKGQFDVVMANIIDGVLLQLQQDLWSRVKRGGHLILSGILTDNENEFKTEFQTQGRSWLKRYARNEWCAWLLGDK